MGTGSFRRPIEDALTFTKKDVINQKFEQNKALIWINTAKRKLSSFLQLLTEYGNNYR